VIKALDRGGDDKTPHLPENIGRLAQHGNEFCCQCAPYGGARRVTGCYLFKQLPAQQVRFVAKYGTQRLGLGSNPLPVKWANSSFLCTIQRRFIQSCEAGQGARAGYTTRIY
jgi:hypothetical protein